MEIKEKYFNLLTFLIILGCAAGILLCWAVHHFWYGKDELGWRPMSSEQAFYMREVRIRNLRNIAALMGRRDIVRELDESTREESRL